MPLLTQVPSDSTSRRLPEDPLDSGRVTDRTGLEECSAELECPRPVNVTADRVNTATGEMRSDPGASFVKACGTWTCPVCGPKKHRRAVAHYAETFAVMPALWFVTLTIDPKIGLSAEESRKWIVKAWGDYRKRLNRRTLKAGGRLAFVSAVESHGTGFAHMHVVMSAPGLDADELAAQWFAVGGGVMVDVQSVNGSGDSQELARRVGYVVKYAIKDAQNPDRPRGRRFLLSSQGHGYDSAPAKARRAAYANEMMTTDNEGDGADKLGPDEVRVYSTDAGASAPPTDPDTPTAEDLKRFAELNLASRSTAFRLKRGDEWFEIEQHADGTRSERRLYGYKSKYERDMEAAERAAARAEDRTTNR